MAFAHGHCVFIRFKRRINLQISAVPGQAVSTWVGAADFFWTAMIDLGPFFAATIDSFAPSRVMMRSASWSAPRSWSANDHVSAVGSDAMSLLRVSIPNSSSPAMGFLGMEEL